MADKIPSPHKAKRTAERQINKDDDPEGDGDDNSGEGDAPGTFQRAPPEVLKARKIVKGRTRLGAGSTSSSPTAGVFANLGEESSSGGMNSINPFAALAPKPPASSPFASHASSTASPASVMTSTAAPGTTPVPTPRTTVSSEVDTTKTAEKAARAGDSTVESGKNAQDSGGFGNKEAVTPSEVTTTKAADEEGAPAATGCVVHPNGSHGSSEPDGPPSSSTPAGGEPTAEQARDPKTAAESATVPSTQAGEASANPERAEQATREKNGDAADVNGGGGKEEAAAAPAVASGDGEGGGNMSAFSAAAAAVGSSGGVISFGALGAVASPFQSLATGASSAAPLTFAGFGSSPATGATTTDGGNGQTPSSTTTGTPASLLFSASGGSGEAGTGASSASQPPTLSFGSSSSTAAFTSFTSFAAAPAGAAWGSAPKGAGTSGGGAAKNGEGVKSNGNVDGAVKKTLEGLLDPSEVVNGEESEECTHRVRAKLFRLASKEWSEMGIGSLKVLRSAADSEDRKEGADDEGKTAETGMTGPSARLVMRREAGQQVVLNVSLQAQMRCTKQGDKALQITCFTSAGPATYLVKVKTPEDADNLKNAIESCIPVQDSAVP